MLASDASSSASLIVQSIIYNYIAENNFQARNIFRKIRSKTKKYPWFDSECKSMKTSLNKSRKSYQTVLKSSWYDTLLREFREGDIDEYQKFLRMRPQTFNVILESQHHIPEARLCFPSIDKKLSLLNLFSFLKRYLIFVFIQKICAYICLENMIACTKYVTD